MRLKTKLLPFLLCLLGFSAFGQNTEAKLLKSTITPIGINAGKINPLTNRPLDSIKAYSEVDFYRVYQSIGQTGNIGTVKIDSTLEVQQGFLNSKLFLRINNSNNSYFDESLEVQNVYPNPFIDDIYIQFSKETNYDIEVTLYDVNGKRHYYEKFEPTDLIHIPMSRFRQRFYILRVRSGSLQFNKKLLKND